jgi:hypothetical protein
MIRADVPMTCEQADAALFKVDLGSATIAKEYVNGRHVLFVFSATGRLIGVPSKCCAGLFEQRLAARGNDDGLWPGHSQTTRRADRYDR